jgi:hypothetical protein
MIKLLPKYNALLKIMMKLSPDKGAIATVAPDKGAVATVAIGTSEIGDSSL